METLRLGAARDELTVGFAAGAKREQRTSFARLCNISRRCEKRTAVMEMLVWQAKRLTFELTGPLRYVAKGPE
jgi:hypothetical protein